MLFNVGNAAGIGINVGRINGSSSSNGASLIATGAIPRNLRNERRVSMSLAVKPMVPIS